MTTPLFEAKQLHKRFGRQVVLEDISLAFAEGQLSGIMGPNGAGKTTCFNVLTGRYAPDRGEVLFAGETITGLAPREIARRGISRSFQIMNLFNDYSALDNVLVALPEVRRRGFDGWSDLDADTAAQDKAATVLGRVGLAGKERTPAKSLSYGERRALEIAVALAAEPRLLFLDEPTAGLGSEGTARLAGLIAELKEAVTIVVIEHDMRFLFALADRISVIHWGQVIAEGTPAELTRESLGAARRPRGKRLMLEIDGIETFYGETQALFGVSLSVRAGEVVALLGPNGAGKTTTLRSILGLTPARAGSIRFDGHDITRATTHEIARRGLSWVPDDRSIFPTLTVARNLSIARKKTRFRGWTEKECFEIFSALEYLMHRECENLSGGEMQMVAIARALVGAPGLVLFDEPSQGLAPKVVQDVTKTILRLKSEGVAILVVEQNVESALAVADRAYVMNLGVIVHHGPARELIENARERERLLGV